MVRFGDARGIDLLGNDTVNFSFFPRKKRKKVVRRRTYKSLMMSSSLLWQKRLLKPVKCKWNVLENLQKFVSVMK